MHIISCKDLAIGYNGRTIRSKINFEVQEGDYLCIVGENGSGKSTLLKTLLNLLNPISGKISFGQGLKATDIGYLPQRTETMMDFPATAYEIVVSGFQGHMGLRPFYTKAEKKQAFIHMETLGIRDLWKKCYRELSGGQQQRVLLARALCATKKLLILDEPVTGLDPNTTSELYEEIATLNKKGITIIMISHDLEGVQKYASHILCLGKEITYDRSDEYIRKIS